MTAGERFRKWADETASGFADRVRTWGGQLITTGAEKIVERFEPEGVESSRKLLTMIRDHPMTPPDVREAIDKMLTPTKWIGMVAAIVVIPLMLIPMVFAVFQPLANLLRYMQERLFKSARIDPMSVITAWRRDPATYQQWFDDLKDLGWSDERIDVLKFATQAYPALADVIRFYAREAFEPDMIAIYGLRDELPPYPGTLFEKLGVPADIAELYWIAHWEHASWIQVVEMLRRGQLTEEQVYQWYRVVEIPPFWRDKLTAISWEVPTRVDVRRFWDMRTIDEARLREIYTARGYHGKDLDDYVLWTKVYVAFPDLMARWKNGWITLDEVKSTLTGLGMPAARVEEFIETKIKATEPERVAGERDLTKTDIYKGVKTGAITRGEAAELLMDLGFDEDEADFLLFINIPRDEEDEVVRQRELTKADVLKGLKTEVITRAEARDRLLDLRYIPVDAEFLLKIFDAQVKPPVEPREREASKADILLGVKKGLITPEEGYGMLLDLGFTPEAADFILMVKAEESPFSPINYAEFKDLTQKYRVAAGMEAKPMPEEIKQAAAEVVRLTGEVEALELSITEEKRGLIDQEVLPEETVKRLKSLQVKRNRAIAKLEKAKSEYDRLIAEWRHGLP